MQKLSNFFIFILLCSCSHSQLTDKHEPYPPSGKRLNQKIETLVPEGWQIPGKVLRYIPENLYEHINGRAEFYLAYNMVSLAFANFEKTAEEKYINVSVYDMGTPENAFGVFSSERSEGGTALALGRDAYQSEANCYVWTGQYYIQIIALGEAGKLSPVTLNIARGLTSSLTDSGLPVRGLEMLPVRDRIPHTEHFFLADAMGLDFLTNAYTAKYRKSGTEVTAFLSQRETELEAREIVKQYAQYAKRYGKTMEHVTIGKAVYTVCDMGGRFDVVSHKGRLVYGVLDTPDRNLAIQSVVEFGQQLNDESR